MSFVCIPDEFRDSLGDQILDYEEYDRTKKRYYYYKVDISPTLFSLIPLRKNCTSSMDYLPIYNAESDKHGFDFQKMVIMDRTHILMIQSIDKKVFQDVTSKEHLISGRVFDNIKKYNQLKNKFDKNQILSKKEKIFISHSTLQYFEKQIKHIN